jgi:hypothetical protein
VEEVVVLLLLESLLLLVQTRELDRVVLVFRQTLLALQPSTEAAAAAESTGITECLILGLCRVSVVLVVVVMAQGAFRPLVLMARQIQVVEVVVALQMILHQELPAGQMVVLVDLELSYLNAQVLTR